MKKTTIKWRIFKYNLVIIILLIVSTMIIFNVAVRQYIEKDILLQLNKIASRAEDTALRKEPPVLSRHNPFHEIDGSNIDDFRYYFLLDRSLREPLSVLNADYVILDNDKNRIKVFTEEYFTLPDTLLDHIVSEVTKSNTFNSDMYFKFKISNIEYVSIIRPLYKKDSSISGWIIIFSSLEKVNQLKTVINIILLCILIFSSIIIIIFSSIISKKISAPFSSLNMYIKGIAERNFASKLSIVVDDELQEFVNNINIMTEKLESYDKAQKTFLENASHEFRTPLMSIQSYSEGILYDVIDHDLAANVIIDESKRLTHLVEDLLYLSRLEAIEENYNFTKLNLNKVVLNCINRLNAISLKSNINLNVEVYSDNILVLADEEKISRSISNIIENSLRYASTTVSVILRLVDDKSNLIVSDDGSGFDPLEIPNLFTRFYKGKNGNFGLGLSISKNIIEKHKGIITAQNTDTGAEFNIFLPNMKE